jgi:cytochrome c biogenesis protein CcmG/thiol:disulfide interchange protein DsbE
MQHDAANPIEEPMNDANAAEPASAPPPTVNRRGAAAVLVVIVVVLAGFFGYVAMAPKGKPADGTLPMDPIGFAVPDLRLPTLNKPGELGLRDLVGKPVVINFWASWCVTCKEEAAIMGDAERKWRDKGVVFIGIDASDKDDEAKKFEALYGMDYESLVDRDGVVGPNWGVTGYPETFFVGRDGRIVSKFISAIDAATLDQRILEILNS